MEGKNFNLFLEKEEVEALKKLRYALNVSNETEAIRYVIKNYLGMEEKKNILEHNYYHLVNKLDDYQRKVREYKNAFKQLEDFDLERN